jgi:ubiquitin-conjugating enzyme E2 A
MQVVKEPKKYDKAHPNSAALRLMSDLKQLQTDPPGGVSASPLSDDNIFVWAATIFGPDETPWEGGVFSLRMTFPETYPDKPPKVRFTTDIFHPNVYPDGSLCLDVIQDKWSPIYSASTILTSIQSLLTDPNPASPANPEAAQLYQKDRKAYNRRVRRCAEASLSRC